MTKDLKFLLNIVKKASRLISKDVHVNAKGTKGDLVTNFDYEVEQFLIAQIKKQYPDFHIISEEFNSKEKKSENYFTIDPIDGTINFANGIPLWGIQVACVRNGKTCAAVIYLKALNELYYADEAGAFMNGKPIHVSNLAPEKVLYTAVNSLSSNKENGRLRRDFYASAIYFTWLSCGRLGAHIFSYKEFPWDITPGIYIAQQAGAVYAENKKFKILANSQETINYFENMFN